MDSMTAASRIGGTGQGRETKTVSVEIQPNKKCCRSEDPFEQLFPRLPNEITLGQIVPKLPWRAFHILAAVSRGWREAIQSHRVYDARIRSCSTDTLVVHGHHYSRNDVRFAKISVHSVRDKLCYDLPPIPGHSKGIPSSCECVSLDGKIYVLGGAIDSMEKRCSHDSSSKVYVMDLAGASHWKECASMERGRQKFGCGVIEGKIYVFGGTHDHRPVRGAEVYNPKVNAWSPIMPMPSLRYSHKSCTFEGEIVVYGGKYYDEDYTDWRAIDGRHVSVQQRDTSFIKVASFLEKYDPGRDVWTVDNGLYDDEVAPASFNDGYYFPGPANMFVVEGQFHVMHEDAIYVSEDPADNQDWRRLKENRFAPLGDPWRSVAIIPRATVVLNGELLAGVDWSDGHDRRKPASALLQSERFDTKSDEICWKVVSNCAATFAFMHCIQL